METLQNSSNAGVAGTVDLQALEQMRIRYEEETSKSRARGQEFCRHQTDYKLLMQKLETLTDQTSYQVMVPFTKKAFMPGRLVHTNEILVLLGDNWFVERSAKQAREICNRRLTSCEETLTKINQEIGLYESWLKEANQLKGDAEHKEGNVEIREDFDAEEVERWKRDRRERVKAAKLEENQSMKADFMDDEDYWKRLEELEMKEELDEYLGEDNQESDQSENDDDETESDSEDDEYYDEVNKSKSRSKSSVNEQREGDSGKSMWQQMEELSIEEELDRHFSKKKLPIVIDDDSLKVTSDHKVSFGENIEHVIASRHDPDQSIKTTNVIQFDHSQDGTTPHSPASTISNDNSATLTPGDLYTIFGTSKVKSPSRSILKKSTFSDELDILEEEEENDVSFEKSSKLREEPAVADLVQEREVVYEPLPPPDGTVLKILTQSSIMMRSNGNGDDKHQDYKLKEDGPHLLQFLFPFSQNVLREESEGTKSTKLSKIVFLQAMTNFKL